MMMRMLALSIGIVVNLALSACGPSQGKPRDSAAARPTDILAATPTSIQTPEPTPIPALDFAFADSEWDGKTIPNGEQCHRQGGENPSTPRIIIKNIPEGTDAIILEFSDRNYGPMDDGGHGKIGFKISEGTKEVVIPSIPGHSFDLPEDFFIIQEHQASSYDLAGAYMPPCSGGIGNSYYVTIKAIIILSEENETFILLTQGVLELGKY